MRKLRLIVLFAGFMSSATAAPLMGQILSLKNISLCAQYSCQLVNKQKLTGESLPFPQTAFTYKVKALGATLDITTATKDRKVLGFALDVPHFPIDTGDEGVFLKLIQQATGGNYRVETLSRCFNKLEANGGDNAEPRSDGYSEELMLARNDIGVKCFTKPFVNSRASGISIFYGD